MASSSHTIRLHGPWRCELFKSLDGAAEVLTVQAPVDWITFLLDRNFESMVWRRSFGRPTNLGDRELVELVISKLRDDAIVRLNEVQIEPLVRTDANTRFVVTDRLEVRNQLALEIRTPSLGSRTEQQPDILNAKLIAGPFGQVYLEIFTDWYDPWLPQNGKG
ncbi:MAG: hypothetical protein HYV60_05755 [Planctomycetia bacterium]|nr:hypothetical protein [Planctomycetia bacterium]